MPKPWWSAERDRKGAAFYEVMRKASNTPANEARGWPTLSLAERDNWCSYAEEYEEAVRARP